MITAAVNVAKVGIEKMNKVILIGRLSKDPEVKYTQGAEPIAVCRFTIAVNRAHKKDGENSADFISCVAFRRTGENIGKFFKKGNRIAVTGRIQTGSYTDQQGNKRYTTDIVVDDFEFVESKGEGNTRPKSDPIPEPSEGFYDMGETDNDEDLPF